jgi:hypothetical protein
MRVCQIIRAKADVFPLESVILCGGAAERVVEPALIAAEGVEEGGLGRRQDKPIGFVDINGKAPAPHPDGAGASNKTPSIHADALHIHANNAFLREQRDGLGLLVLAVPADGQHFGPAAGPGERLDEGLEAGSRRPVDFQDNVADPQALFGGRALVERGNLHPVTDRSRFFRIDGLTRILRSFSPGGPRGVGVGAGGAGRVLTFSPCGPPRVLASTVFAAP